MARLDAPLPADLTRSRRSFSWVISDFPRFPSVQRSRHRTLSIGTQEKPLRNVKAATDEAQIICMGTARTILRNTFLELTACPARGGPRGAGRTVRTARARARARGRTSRRAPRQGQTR